MCSKVAASYTTFYWTVYQYLIKLGQSFKLPLNYTQRKCLSMQNAWVGFKIESLWARSIFLKYIDIIFSNPSLPLVCLQCKSVCKIYIYSQKCLVYWLIFSTGTCGFLMQNHILNCTDNKLYTDLTWIMLLTEYTCLSKIQVTFEPKGSIEMRWNVIFALPSSSIFVWYNYMNRFNGFITMEMCYLFMLPFLPKLDFQDCIRKHSTAAPVECPQSSPFHPKVDSSHVGLTLFHLKTAFWVSKRKTSLQPFNRSVNWWLLCSYGALHHFHT